MRGKQSGWKAVVHLAVHAVLGMVIFCIVAIPAVLLGRLVKVLEDDGASAYIVFVLTFVEYAVLTADAASYLYLLGKSLYKQCKDLEL